MLFDKFQKKSQNQSSYTYLLFPAVILISPILGFQDTIFSFFVILALLNISKSKFLLAGVVTGCAILSKQLALIPMFGIIFVVLIQQSKIRIAQFFTGLTCSVALILSPFLVNGRILSYLESQSLTSIHTMLSAQASNFPWLISLISRFVTLDFNEAVMLNGNGLRIADVTLRQFSYLAAGSIVFIIFPKCSISKVSEINMFSMFFTNQKIHFPSKIIR
jgi:4-amino-4-deoxy-L-arabinose transferase-like glycosyltransferase